jgi:ketosteroid isomerase-like protein
MSNLQTIADRVEIEALRGEFTDAGMMRDYDSLASLFTHDSAVRIPDINAEAVGREEIRAEWSGCRWPTCPSRSRCRY